MILPLVLWNFSTSISIRLAYTSFNIAAFFIVNYVIKITAITKDLQVILIFKNTFKTK